MKTSLALLISGLAAQQVAATWDIKANHFKTPQYNNNECSDKQKEGFNWGDLPTGGFSGYGDFNFGGGWTCANSFGKRDSLTKRTFGSKCVKNSCTKEKPAAFDCSKRKDGFSITEMQVSVEFDCDLEWHYKMPDGGVCKHVTPCKKEGTTVKNTQCGGAQSVEVYLGNHNEQKGECEIGLHHIGFDCNPGYGGKSSTIIISTPTPTPSQPTEESSSVPIGQSSSVPIVESSSVPIPESSTQPPESTIPYTSLPTPESSAPVPESSAPYINSSIPIPESTTPPAPESTLVYSTAVESTGVYSSPVEIPSSSALPQESSSSTVELTTSIIYSTVTSTITSCADTVTNCPANQASTVYVTSVIAVGTTVCPVTPTGPPTPPESTTSSPQPTGPSTPYNPPSVLPQCMNTWLEINSECKDNTDVNCYCKNADFTSNVIECVKAWSTDAEIQQALSYLVGICASYVPQNPGLITNCPSTVPLGPTNPSTPEYSQVVPSGSAPPMTTAAPTGVQPAGPVTTIIYQTTVTVPCSSAGSEISGSSTVSTISTAVTVPQVVFTTNSPGQPGVTQSAPVNLVPGTPAPIPAVTTGAYPLQSSLGTVIVPGGNATATTTEPAKFTGAASSVSIKYTSGLLAVVLALFAL